MVLPATSMSWVRNLMCRCFWVGGRHSEHSICDFESWQQLKVNQLWPSSSISKQEVVAPHCELGTES